MPDRLVDLERDLLAVQHDRARALRALRRAEQRDRLLGHARGVAGEVEGEDVLPARGGAQAAAVGGRVGAHLQVAAVGGVGDDARAAWPPSPACTPRPRSRRRPCARATRGSWPPCAPGARRRCAAPPRRRRAARACPPGRWRTGRPRRARTSARAPARPAPAPGPPTRGCASARASARASAARAPARVTSRVAAKPQPPPTCTRTPMPSEPELSIASTRPLRTAIASLRASTWRASAYAQRPTASLHQIGEELEHQKAAS